MWILEVSRHKLSKCRSVILIYIYIFSNITNSVTHSRLMGLDGLDVADYTGVAS